jgi:thiol reductant ABC exporter CydD subunit
MFDHTYFLRGNRKASLLLLFAIFAGTVAGALFIIQALLISEIVNRIFLLDQSLSAITYLLAAAILLMIIRAGLIWIKESIAQHSASSVKDSLRNQFIRKLFVLGPSYVQGESSGELTHTLVDGIDSLNDYFTLYLPAKALAVLVPSLVLIVVLILDPWTTLVFIVAGPMLLLLLALIGGQTKVIQQRRFQEMSWMSAFFLDMLQGLPTLKLFGRSREQADNIEEISSQYGKTTMEVLRTAFQTSLVLEWSATAATAMVALEVSFRLVNGSLPFDVALAVLLLTPEFFLPLRRYALRYHAGAQAKAVAKRLSAVLDTAELTTSHLSRLADTIPYPLEGPLADICFEDVSFAYQNGQRPALSNISLTIPHGRSVALVGPTGAGKSTISSLLLRFIEPSGGVINIGSTPLLNYALDMWRSQVAWVPQYPYLFYGSVAENILLASPSASKEKMLAASYAANAHEFIHSLPYGYDTQLGEKGIRLSGGQRQRIAIARAFLKDAPFLILDEATSHLDTENEELIAAALSALVQGRTTLIIAHRLALVYKADQIVVMNNGRVTQCGSHEDLLSQEGPYRQLYASYSGETSVEGFQL